MWITKKQTNKQTNILPHQRRIVLSDVGGAPGGRLAEGCNDL